MIILAAFAPVQEFRGASTESLFSATYSNGILNFNIPFHTGFPGDGKLTVEVLDPEDSVLARTETEVKVSNGTGLWHAQLKLDPPPAPDEVVWNRLHYRFDYSDKVEKSI